MVKFVKRIKAYFGGEGYYLREILGITGVLKESVGIVPDVYGTGKNDVDFRDFERDGETIGGREALTRVIERALKKNR